MNKRTNNVPDGRAAAAGAGVREDGAGPEKRRKGIRIMAKLVGLVRPLLPVMCGAVILGVAGALCAAFLSIFAGYELIHGLLAALGADISREAVGTILSAKPLFVFAALILMAVLRGILHYGEQYCNHFIAFKLLAVIRNKVFAALRRLSPAKLAGREKGSLILVITSDTELLEVFYAHTISPVAIGILTSLFMTVFIGRIHPAAGLLAFLAYLTVGAFIPLVSGRKGAGAGMDYRTAFGSLSSFVLDSMRGVSETIQYGDGAHRKEQMEERSRKLGVWQEKLNRLEAGQKSGTNLAILGFSFAMLFLMFMLAAHGHAGFADLTIAVIAMMSSFGPVTALANLSNNLNQTLASGERVLKILEEEPEVPEVTGEKAVAFAGMEVRHAAFSYGKERILGDTCLEIPKGKMIGLHGASGCGKSTLLKLLMRFFDVQGGSVEYSGVDIRQVNTEDLRAGQSLVTQETYLFHDSIANNIAIGKEGATRREIEAAAKKAAIHAFIESLTDGYDTEVGELGDTLSGGQRQRIGLARTFLHDAPMMLLDEPTSNLDALNEGIILKSLRESCADKTVVLVSHRDSTMRLADVVYEMDRTSAS